ncbi:MAG TPA: (deoxy)nucleoside triphosphate pyrophosphohydrolase [Acidobacteriota bacterium]
MILVAAGLIYKDGRLLIAQRPEGKHGALKWEFPGGKIEQEEDPRESLAREVTEELGIRIEVLSPVEIIFYRYPERSVLLLFYNCRWISGEPQKLDCRDFACTLPRDLKSYDFLEADLDFIAKLERSVS